MSHRYCYFSWWRHQIETFSALPAICAGNSPVPGEFPAQRPVTRSFDVFFDMRLNKRLSKQSWGRWFEMLSRPLWCHRNVFSPFPYWKRWLFCLPLQALDLHQQFCVPSLTNCVANNTRLGFIRTDTSIMGKIHLTICLPHDVRDESCYHSVVTISSVYISIFIGVMWHLFDTRVRCRWYAGIARLLGNQLRIIVTTKIS